MICKRCKKDLHESEFYYSITRNWRNKICKQCNRDYQKKHRKYNRITQIQSKKMINNKKRTKPDRLLKGDEFVRWYNNSELSPVDKEKYKDRITSRR